MLAADVQVEVLAVGRLRCIDVIRAEATETTEMGGAVHERHERMRVPAHRAHTAGHAHELDLSFRIATATVIEGVLFMTLSTTQAIPAP
jgi:hypothetical protein